MTSVISSDMSTFQALSLWYCNAIKYTSEIKYLYLQLYLVRQQYLQLQSSTFDVLHPTLLKLNLAQYILVKD